MKQIIILLLAILSCVGFAAADITCSETMTRTAPATAGGNFQITYTAIGASGSWGASIEESVTGGCTFPSGSSTYKTVMLSEDGATKTVTITAPVSGTCVFTGNYMFGSCSILNFANSQVVIGSGACTPDCSCAATTCTGTTCPDTCGGNCDGTKTCSSICTPSWTCTPWSNATASCGTRTCTDSNNCGVTTNKPAETATCSGTTTETKCEWFEKGTPPDCEINVSMIILGAIGLVVLNMLMK